MTPLNSKSYILEFFYRTTQENVWSGQGLLPKNAARYFPFARSFGLSRRALTMQRKPKGSLKGFMS